MMWKRIAPALIVLSVALNAAFISGWATGAVRAHWLARRVADHAEIWCPLHRELNVSPEQWRRIEPRMEEFRGNSQALCQDISRLRAEMIDLLASSQADPEAIRAKQQQILAGQGRMQELVVARLMEEKQVLTKEQQTRLFEMIKNRTGCLVRNPMMRLGLAQDQVAP